MALSEHNNISIAQIVLFTPALAIGIFLCAKHGFGRAAGWLYLVIFSLARLLGASLQLATIADPTNLSLYFGAVTLQNIGLSPLCLILLAMVNRLLMGIEEARSTIINPRVMRLGQLVVIIGLILSSVGGSNSGNNYAKTGVYTVSSLSQAGLGLTIAGFALVLLAAAVVWRHISAAEDGEKRILLAVAISVPFLFVRILYSAIGIFGTNPDFSQVTGNINILLGMAVIEEIIIVFVVEAVALTLKVQPKVIDPNARKGPISRLFGHLFGKRREDYEMTSSDSHRNMSHV